MSSQEDGLNVEPHVGANERVNRIRFLNRLITAHQYRSYLEIGVSSGRCLAAINAPFKVGVDPDPTVRQLRIPRTLLFCMASDQFFANTSDGTFFDLVFVDGLHHHQQVYRDVLNALDRLNVGGTIVLHDCNPRSEVMQRVPRVQAEWTGDCWKAIARLRMSRRDLKVSVLDTEYGLGVVQRGKNKPITYLKPWQELGWDDLDEHRTELLGLTSLTAIDHYLTKWPPPAVAMAMEGIA